MIKLWAEHSSEELKNAKTVILPISSTEQHGRHLPVGTDALLVAGLVERIIGKETSEDVYVLPSINYGKSPEHADFPGTITISAHTLIALLEDICCSLAEQEVENLVILNGHGGNNGIIEGSLYDLHATYGLNTYFVRFGGMCSAVANDKRFDYPWSCHAGFAETSVMEYMYPRFERLYAKVGGKIEGEGMTMLGTPAVGWGWKTQEISPVGHIGDPTESDPKVGEEVVAKVVDFFLQNLELIIKRGN